MADLEMNLAELESVKQTFKSKLNANSVSTSNVEFRNYPQLFDQLEKKLPTQTKSVTPTKSAQSVLADAGYKLNKVEVDPIPSEYIIPNGTIEITENKIYDVTNYASAEVSVPSQEPNLIEGSASINGTYYASDEGADGYSAFVVNVPTGGGNGGLGMALNTGVSEIIDVTGEVTDVRSSAFYKNNYLVTVTLPNCTQLHSSAFFSSPNLQSVSVPNCSIIHNDVFAYCSNLSYFNGTNVKSIWTNAFCSTKISVCSFPKCDQVMNSAYSGCSELKEVNLPVARMLWSSVFANCYSLQKVNLPQCVSIGKGTFESCHALTEFFAPECSDVHSRAFAYCGISYLSFSKMITVSSTAFAYATNLEEIDLPNAKSVLTGAFSSCSALTSVKIPECTFLGASALTRCTSLSEIYLPKCQKILSSAFANCSALACVVLGYSTCALIHINAFANTPISNSSYLGYFGSIYVPDEYVDAYKVSTNWVTYSDRITSLSNLPTE